MASLEMLKICGRGSELFIHQYIHAFRVCMIRVSYSILLNWHAQLHMLLDSKSEMTYTELRDYISDCLFVCGSCVLWSFSCREK